MDRRDGPRGSLTCQMKTIGYCIRSLVDQQGNSSSEDIINIYLRRYGVKPKGTKRPSTSLSNVTGYPISDNIIIMIRKIYQRQVLLKNKEDEQRKNVIQTLDLYV